MRFFIRNDLEDEKGDSNSTCPLEHTNEQEIAIKNKQHSAKFMNISYLFFAIWQPNYPQDSSER